MRAFILRLSLFINLMIFGAAAVAEFTASLGIQSTQLFITSDTDLASVAYDGTDSNQSTDAGFEAAVGYRFQVNDDFAIDLDLLGQRISTQTDVPTIAGNDPFATQDANASLEWLWGLRLRPGYQITDLTRFFLDVGLVWGHFDIDYSDQTLISTGLDDDTDRTLTGWRYGIGLEQAITDFLVISLDYTITEFESTDTDNIFSPASANGDANSTTYTPTLHTLGFNVKVLFGDDWF